MIYRLAFSISQKYLVSMRNRYLSKAVDPSQNIADLGSGNNPFRHARVCVDKFDSDDIQRGGRILAKPVQKEMKDVDLNSYPYPFKDKEMDFVLCSHVLEHLDNPVQACVEMSRIARAGYIEMPAFSSDIFMRPNDSIHQWLCLYDKSKETIFFLNRKFFKEGAGPCHLPIWTRFFLSLKVTRILWKGRICGEYLSSESWK